MSGPTGSVSQPSSHPELAECRTTDAGKIPAMNPSLQKLQKFFKLEAERGYDDRAVVGGLERMLTPWEAEARAAGLSEEIIAAVLARLRDYHRLSPASRQESLQGLWRRIQRNTEQEPPPG